MAGQGENAIWRAHGRSILTLSLVTMATRYGIVVINIPTAILVARLLGPEGQGIYTSALVFPTLFAFVGLLGIDASHTFLLSKKRYSLAQINAQSVFLSAALSTIAVPAYLVFIRFYGAPGGAEVTRILNIAAALIPVLMAKSLSVGLMLGLQEIRWFNRASLIQASVLLVLMVLNLLVVRGGVMGALVVYLASEVVVTVVALRVAKATVGSGPLLERPPPGLLKTSMVYGLQGHVGNVLVQLMFRVDTLIILSMLGPAPLGIYSIAAVTAEKLLHLSQSVQIVLFPRLSSLDADEANELTPRVARSTFLLTVVAGSVLFLISKPILLLFFGDAYLPGLRVLRILIPGVALLSFTAILSGDFSARDRRIYHTVANAIGFGMNLLLCLVWIPRIGIEGAAWASTVAYTTQGVVMLVLFKRLSGRGILETVLVRREDLYACASFLKGKLRSRR